jgi:hypothetical protein
MPGSIFSYTLKEPIGVVAAIVPWNRAISNAIGKLAPALAAGCTVVLKPAEEASLVAIRLAELVTDLGFPDGAVNVVTGPGETVGAALTEHPDVDKVAFTGSTATGQRILRAAAGNLKRVTLELGGKSPDVVFADADLARAVPGAAMGVFSNSGQVCCAGTRIYAERPIYDEFVAGLPAVWPSRLDSDGNSAVKSDSDSRTSTPRAWTVRFSMTVSDGKMPRPSGRWQMPRRLYRCGASPVTSSPSKAMRPERGRTKPVAVRSSVVLPAPLGPSNAMTSPSPTVKSTPRSTVVSP